MIYLDSCALVKLVLAEAETLALERFLAANAGQTHVTAALARTEVRRVVRRAAPELTGPHEDADRLLAEVYHVPLDDELLDTAGTIGDTVIRSLDAIHLAAALSLGPWLRTFITYDHRLAKAAEDADLPVAAPA